MSDPKPDSGQFTRSSSRLSGPSRDGASVHLAVGAQMSVVVRTPLGDPVQGASVTANNTSMSGTTDASGNYNFGSVSAGSYTVSGSLQMASGTQTQTVGPGTSVQFVVVLPWTLVAHWVDTQKLCGDNASIEIGVVPVPAACPLTVDVLHPSTGASVATLNATLTGGNAQLVWPAKAQTANWRTDQMDFRVNVSGIGLTGNASNKFTFLARPTTTWTALNNDHGTPAGYADVYEIVDAELEAAQVHYSLKLKLTPPSGATAVPWNAARQSTEKAAIENIWNNGFGSKKFHRTKCVRARTCDCAFDCCKAGFRFDVNFVTSGEHFAVEIRPSATPGRSGTSRTGSFWVDPAGNPATDYAHEVGHMLGQFDEYTGGANDPAGTQPVAPATADLMSSGGVSTLLNMHYRWVLAYLNANTNGDVYEILPP